MAILHMCFNHGLKMYMWFGYNPNFFYKLNFFKLYFYQVVYVRATPALLDHSSFILNNLGGGHNCSEFACIYLFPVLIFEHMRLFGLNKFLQFAVCCFLFHCFIIVF